MRKIIAISLALLTLSSNMGFAIATHYCDGTAVESKLTLSYETLDCGMNEQPCQFEQVQEPQLDKAPCCENEYYSLDVGGDYELTAIKPFLNFDFVVAFVAFFLKIIFPSETLTSQYSSYFPPPIEQDFSILYQVFRI